MEANPHSPAIFESRTALIVWCLLAGLALAPLPALHALPSTFTNFLFESPLPIWTRMTIWESYWFALLGLPTTVIFFSWSLPGVGRSGLPKRSIVVLCLLVAYSPLRYFFETHFYGEKIARVTEFYSWDSPLLWTIQHLDTLFLIGLAAFAALRRHRLRPLQKILFHWILFYCALWAVGPLYDSVFREIIVFRTFGI